MDCYTIEHYSDDVTDVWGWQVYDWNACCVFESQDLDECERWVFNHHGRVIN